MYQSALLKFLLLLAFIFFTNPLLIQRIEDIGLQFGLLVYLLVWLVSVMTMVLVAYSSMSVLKLLIASLLICSSVISLSYFEVTQQYMEIFELEVLLNATDNFNDAISTFSGLIWVLVVASIGLIGFLLPSKLSLSIADKKRFFLAPNFLVLLLLITVLFAREGEGTRAMPSQYTSIAYWLTLMSEKVIQPEQKEAPELLLKPNLITSSGDLVFIMDESMRGDYYDINSATGVPTSMKDHAPINFGVASSFANCSAPSNRSMRYGVSKSSYLQDVYNKPSFWQFAKKAGFHTVYIDTQHAEGAFGNHMTEIEADFIDDFIQVLDKDVVLHKKDVVAASLLHEKLNNDVKDFIYINKTGAHFPFEGKYPESEKHYLPTMPPSGFSRSFHEVDEVKYPVSGDALTRLRFVNSYKNTLSWNLTSFFGELFKNDISRPYTMIYTSDHGQTFHDDGRKGYGTHCSIQITDPEEGRVPLVAFSNIEKVRAKIGKAAELNYGKASHFNLPATIYSLMGYDESELSQYHDSLFRALKTDDQIFLSKYYVRFGGEPIWNSIYDQRESYDLDHVVSN